MSNNGKCWLKLSVSCPVELAEAAGDLLAALSGCGVEQSPEQAGECQLAGFFAVNAEDAGETARIERESALALTELFALYKKPAPALTSEFLADEDWATSWQQYFKPFAVVPGLVIKPSWEEYAAKPGEQVVEMDPGMAFGTGQHASTRMALALLREASGQGGPMLDVGTGTGILALAGVLWGAESALALDNDPDALRVAAENVAKNGLAAKIKLALTPLAEIQEAAFPLVTANIVHDVLVAMQDDLARLTAPSGFLILAGILSGQQEENILRLYAAAGFRKDAVQYADEWVALRFRRG